MNLILPRHYAPHSSKDGVMFQAVADGAWPRLWVGQMDRQKTAHLRVQKKEKLSCVAAS